MCVVYTSDEIDAAICRGWVRVYCTNGQDSCATGKPLTASQWFGAAAIWQPGGLSHLGIP